MICEEDVIKTLKEYYYNNIPLCRYTIYNIYTYIELRDRLRIEYARIMALHGISIKGYEKSRLCVFAYVEPEENALISSDDTIIEYTQFTFDISKLYNALHPSIVNFMCIECKHPKQILFGHDVMECAGSGVIPKTRYEFSCFNIDMLYIPDLKQIVVL